MNDGEQLLLNLEFEELEYDQARAGKEYLEQTMQSPGWAIFLQFIEQRANIRERELYDMVPSTTQEMVKFAMFKGGIQELRMIPVIMEQVLSDLKEQVKKAQDVAADEEEFGA
jgi:hypothetical protein